MRLGVAATPTVAIPTLEWLVNSRHTLVRTITVEDKPAGRGRTLSASPVAQWSQDHGVACLKPKSSSELLSKIEDLDLVITIGYGVILPESILSLPKKGFINLHFSLLPLYRGAAPVQRAIQNGETQTGVTVFQLDKGMDTGPIYVSAQQNIDPSWRSSELLEVLSHLGPSVIQESLDAIEAGLLPYKQIGASSLASKLTVEEGAIDWKDKESTITNLVRAFYPQPCAYSFFRKEKIKITKISASVQELSLVPGEIVTDGKSVYVGCGSNTSLELLSVIPSGKAEMKAADWARGARFTSGEKLG